MGKGMKRLFIALGILVILFGINQMQQSPAESSDDGLAAHDVVE